jgi:predicted nucleic acid-binding protein
MQKTIIADSSCIILLDKIEELALLKKLFGEVIITSTIAEEFGSPLPDWILIKDAENKKYQSILELSVDKGEASAIALAVEQTDSLLILDDQKARKLAAELKLKYTGTLALLVEAKLKGHLTSLRPIINKIRKTNFHLTPELEKKIIKSAGE